MVPVESGTNFGLSMKLKILSWNIWTAGNFETVINFIKDSNADIVGLQEVVSDDSSRDIIGEMKKLGYEGVFKAALKKSKSFPGKVYTDGPAVFSKHKIVNSESYFDLSEKDNRAAVKIEVEIDRKIVSVLSTHLLHTHQKPSEIQEMQVKNLLSHTPDEKAIVMGDFNATPESVAIQTMKMKLSDADPQSQPTWSLYPEGCPVTCRPESVSIRLDYIFTTKDLKTSSFKVESSKASDHLPVTATLYFKS